MDELLDGLGQEEEVRIQQAQAIYSKIEPMPVYEEPLKREIFYVEPTYRESFGLETTLIFLAVIGSMIVSAITVGLMLFISAVNTDLLLLANITSPWLSAFVSSIPVFFFLAGIVAFEGYALGFGIARGKESGKMVFSPWALIAAGVVMISTGLLRSLGLITGITGNPVYDFVQWVVVLSTGVGAPVIVFFGSENIGVFINKYEALKKNKWDQYQDDLLEEEKRFHNAKLTSHQDYLEIRNAWGKRFAAYYRRNAGLIFGVDRSIPTGKKREDNEEELDGIKAKVIEYLASRQPPVTAWDVGIKPGDLLSPKDIATALGLKKSDPVRTVLTRLRKGE